MNSHIRIMLALLAGLFIAGPRFSLESSMPSLVPYDAQGGVWVANAIVASGTTFILAAIVCDVALRFFGKRKYLLGILSLLPLFFIGNFTYNRMNEFKQIRTALLDAQDPATSPERLSDLVDYRTGFGYEINNRIASNPSTTKDVLRSLYGKRGQVGTKMSLARNPNTPDDILLDMAKRDDSWKEYIQESLEANPRYKELK